MTESLRNRGGQTSQEARMKKILEMSAVSPTSHVQKPGVSSRKVTRPFKAAIQRPRYAKVITDSPTAMALRKSPQSRNTHSLVRLPRRQIRPAQNKVNPAPSIIP